MNIIMFIQNNGNTNIMILGTPHRHCLVEYSYVNRAIKVFNLWCLKQRRRKVKTVPDKLVVEDKCVADCPVAEPKIEPDKLYNSTTKAVRTSKKSNKPPITKKNYVLW
jgi:hypothetical protein